MIFVRDDDLRRLGLPEIDLQHPERLFVAEWINPTRLSTLKRKLRNATAQRVAVKLENLLHERVLRLFAEPMAGRQSPGPAEPKGT
jgi:hypothetical protein